MQQSSDGMKFGWIVIDPTYQIIDDYSIAGPRDADNGGLPARPQFGRFLPFRLLRKGFLSRLGETTNICRSRPSHGAALL